jgi:hypothetical protein
MQAEETIGIDLPQGARLGGCKRGVWIAYNDPAWLSVRHGLRHDTADAVHRRGGGHAHRIDISRRVGSFTPMGNVKG